MKLNTEHDTMTIESAFRRFILLRVWALLLLCAACSTSTQEGRSKDALSPTTAQAATQTTVMPESGKAVIDPTAGFVVTVANNSIAESSSTSIQPTLAASDVPNSMAQLALEISNNEKLPLAWVQEQLQRAKVIERVRELIVPVPPAKRNWAEYQKRFTGTTRVSGGVEFVKKNKADLLRAEQRWGVPAHIIAAVMGVETFYGRIQGSYPVLDALTTLSLHFPKEQTKDRSPYFRSELSAYLRWCYTEQTDPREWLGSYAGAIGMSQFMPSNILKLAQDFDEDGRINLKLNSADAIGSVANYLSYWGWKKNGPLYFEVTLAPEADIAKLTASDVVVVLTREQMAKLGATFEATGQTLGPAELFTLVELPNAGLPPKYVVTTQNFYTITRYNHSAFYALAVIQLAELIQQQL